MSYSISCVLLIPAIHVAVINQLAEELGYGPNNLSRELVDAQGSLWYGCHTWAMQSFLDQIANPPAEVGLIPGATEALAALVVSTIDGGESGEHWGQVLAAHGLSAVAPEVLE